MKYLKQLSIIIGISFLGEIAAYFIPFPVPASVYGILILFFSLLTGIIKLDMVETTADFMLEIMPLLFVPAGVGLMNVWDRISGNIFEILVVTVVSTVLVMAVSGLTSQAIIKRRKNKEKSIPFKERKETDAE